MRFGFIAHPGFKSRSLRHLVGYIDPPRFTQIALFGPQKGMYVDLDESEREVPTC
jgi:hypothetical protein